MGALTNRAIGSVAGEGRLTGEQCAAVAKMLREEGQVGVAELKEGMDVWDRWCALDEVQEAALGRPVVRDGETVAGLGEVATSEVEWDEVMKRVNGSEDEMMGMVGLEKAEARAHALKARKARLGDVGRLRKQAGETREAYTGRVGTALEEGLVVDEMREGDILRRAELEERMVGVVLEAAAYRAREGKWAEEMEEILGKGEKAPVDMQGDVVEYAVTEKGVRVSGKDMDGRGVTVGVVDR